MFQHRLIKKERKRIISIKDNVTILVMLQVVLNKMYGIYFTNFFIKTYKKLE